MAPTRTCDPVDGRLRDGALRRYALVGALLLASLTLLAGAGAIHDCRHDDGAQDHGAYVVGCEAYKPYLVQDGEREAFSAVETAEEPADPLLDAVDETLDRRILDAYTRTCESEFGDAGRGRDAGATIAEDPIRITAGAKVTTGWFVDCRSYPQRPTASISQRDVDAYAFRVERGELVAAATTEGGCRLVMPGDDPDSGQGSATCEGPRKAQVTGTAYVLAWSAEARLVTRSAPRPYALTLTTTKVSQAEQTDAERLATLEAGTGQAAVDADGPASSRDVGTRSDLHSRTHRLGHAPRQTPRPGPVLALTVAVLAALGSLLLYRRLSRDDALDNDLRSRILDLVEDDPGVTPTEIADELDVATNTVIYHARVLTETDYISTDRSGQRTRYFASGACDARTAKLQAMLRQAGKRDVLLAAREEPGRSLSSLARRLDRHRSTVKHHVDALVEEGLLVAEHEGNGRRVAVPEPLRDLDVWDRAGA